jgi:hypothetical protein
MIKPVKLLNLSVAVIRSKHVRPTLNCIATREASRHFRYRKRKYLKDKIDEFATGSKNKNIETSIEE